jgi:hypothetical protein
MTSNFRANRAAAGLLVAALLAVPAVAYAINLTTSGGFLFDVAETTTGQLSNGTIDAYDNAYILQVNVSTYSAAGVAPTMTLSGRQMVMAERVMGALRVQRLVYVPASGGDYARYLDVVSNPSAAPVLATVRISGNLGSQPTTVTSGTSSGDLTVSTADNWFATDDATDGTGDPSTAHVLQGGGTARVSATMVSLVGDQFFWEFSTMVPAGGRVCFLTFAIQEMTRAASIAEANRLAALPSEAFVGIETFVPDIVNFPVGGAPLARFTSPDPVDEGMTFDIDLEVIDLEGDTPTWTWDVNNDGTFGDMPDATTFSVPAGTTDGDGTYTVGVEMTDGTNTRVATHTVQVRNVDPTITSSPPLEAGVRREYSYMVTVDDPAGPLDPPEVRLITRPGGMEVSPEGLITWTPIVDFRGMTVPVAIRVLDGDGAMVEQRWDIVVAENTAPTNPVPLSPINRMRVPTGVAVTLEVMNGSDPDGDPLYVYFQIARTSSFSGPASSLTGSGAISEEPDGTTSWRTAGPLEPGLWYWRVWVGDGIVETSPTNASFVVGDEPVDAGPPDGGGLIPLPDAGIPETPRDGCTCRAAGSGPRSHGAILLALGLGVVVATRTASRRRNKGVDR